MAEIIEIPLEDLHDSPSNPRQVFDQVGLQELAANIRELGRVLQPLKVRPRVTPLFQGDPDDFQGYEIVFGHRRKRAAELAGLKTAPCMVVQMTDQEVLQEQVAENLQRADVHPIEEAEGYKQLIDSHGHTADSLVQLFGKTRTYVYSRLKLLQACPEVRKACLSGEIGAEVALLIARLRTPKLQAKALQYIEGKYLKLEDGGKKSFRAVRDLLNERFALELKGAMFDPKDATLVPAAGSCETCPKRSGNAPEYADIAAGNPKGRNGYYEGHIRHEGANVCTDPDCFDLKKNAHLARAAKELERRGKVVIGGNRARAIVSATGEIKGGYIPIKTAPPEVLGFAAQAHGCQVLPITIQDPRTGKTHEVVKLDEAKAAAAKLGVAEPKAPPAPSRYGETPEQAARREKERQREQEKLQRINAERRALFDQVRAATAATPRSLFDLRWIARTLYQERMHGEGGRLVVEVRGFESHKAALAAIDAMEADQLSLLMLDLVISENVVLTGTYLLDNPNFKPSALYDFATHYGIARMPPTAARAAKKGAGKAAPTSAALAPAGAAGKAKRRPLQAGGDPGAPDDAGLFDEVKDEAGCAGQEQTDDAGCAVGSAGQVDEDAEEGAT